MAAPATARHDRDAQPCAHRDVEIDGTTSSVDPVSYLDWSAEPRLTQPVIIAAFEGWNDAGDASSKAVQHLIDVWSAERFASIDAEEFYDFTSTRPKIRIVDGHQRAVDWPTNEFYSANVGGTDVILLLGNEPQLKWRTFCAQILEVQAHTSARLVLTLGALLADVPHTRPSSVYGTAYDQSVIDALSLEASSYEGPTGIVGVLHTECRRAGVNSASLWAAVPSYVSSAPSPKAQRALVERVAEILHCQIDVADIDAEEAIYNVQINALVEEDSDTVEYVRHLEEEHDRGDAEPDVDELVEELERFLRDQ